jgi:hypothetical protein
LKIDEKKLKEELKKEKLKLKGKENMQDKEERIRIF